MARIQTTTRPMRTAHAPSNRQRRIGRKALQADRLARALGASKATEPKFAWLAPLLRPKIIALACAIVISVTALGFVGSQSYAARVAAAKKAEVAEQQNKAKAKSAAAVACRQQKVQQKADLIGKVTYDELYDYGECDK